MADKNQSKRILGELKYCDTVTIRCIERNTKGERRCGVVCNTGLRVGAVINENKGTIRYYK